MDIRLLFISTLQGGLGNLAAYLETRDPVPLAARTGGIMRQRPTGRDQWSDSQRANGGMQK